MYVFAVLSMFSTWVTPTVWDAPRLTQGCCLYVCLQFWGCSVPGWLQQPLRDLSGWQPYCPGPQLQADCPAQHATTQAAGHAASYGRTLLLRPPFIFEACMQLSRGPGVGTWRWGQGWRLCIHVFMYTQENSCMHKISPTSAEECSLCWDCFGPFGLKNVHCPETVLFGSCFEWISLVLVILLETFTFTISFFSFLPPPPPPQPRIVTVVLVLKASFHSIPFHLFFSLLWT